MANKLPYFPFYPRDFSGDAKVEAMTTEEVGAYALLLCKAWHEEPAGSIPADDTILARWARMDAASWRRCSPAVLSCFVPSPDGTRYYQKRMREEYRRLRAVMNARSEAGKKGASARWQTHCGGNADAPICVSDSASDSSPDTQEGGARGETRAGRPAGFDAFWAAYPRKRAKKTAHAAWLALAPPPELVETILAAVERQRGSGQWRRGVIPNPATWLDEHRWEDADAPAANGRPAAESAADRVARLSRQREGGAS